MGAFAYWLFFELWRLLGFEARFGSSDEAVAPWIHLAQKLFHVLLFGAFGWLAGSTPAGRTRLRAVAGGLAVCVAAELLQLAMPTRHASVLDGVLNVVCFAAGAFYAGFAGVRGAGPDAL